MTVNNNTNSSAVSTDMNDDIENKVINIVKKMLKLENKVITKETKFEDLGLDSLDIVELMMTFEDECGCTIPDDQASKMITLDHVISFVMNQHKE